MFNDENEIYNSIAENILTAVSGDWDMVLLDVFIFDVDKSIGIKGVSTFLGEETFFNILKSDFEHRGVSTSAAFFELYKRMKRSDSDTPWNKCRFSLSYDGDLDIEFKLDLDLKWYCKLKHDSQMFEDLDADIVDLIKTWEGIPDGFDRFWLV